MADICSFDPYRDDPGPTPPMPDLQAFPSEHLNWHARYDRPTTVRSEGFNPPWSCDACDEHAQALRMMQCDRAERAEIWQAGFDAAMNNMNTENPWRKR